MAEIFIPPGAGQLAPSEPAGQILAGSVVQLDPVSAGTLPSDVPLKFLCEYRGPPVPCEVACNTEIVGALSAAFPSFGSLACCGGIGLGQNDPPVAAFFKLTYGRGGLVRRRWIDLQSGLFYLGVCDSVRVECARWQGSTAWPSIPAVTLFANAAIGVDTHGGGAYDEMTCTALDFLASGTAASTRLQVQPPGATQFEVGVGIGSASYWSTAGMPRFRWYNSQLAYELLWDAANNLVLPPFRRHPLATIHQGTPSGITVRWDAATPGDMAVMTKFILNA